LKQRQFPVAEQYLNQSLRLFQELGNTLSETVVLGNLGYVAQQNGDYDEAVKRLTRSREILEQLPNTLHRQADVLHNLANIHWSQQEYGQARATHEEALALRERLGSRPGIANSHDGLGWAFLGLGDLDAAERYFGQSLPVFQEISDGEGVIFGMEGLAKVALGREQFERAVKLLIYIASMLGEQPAEMYENELNQAAERLSRDEYAAAEAVGRGLTREAALALALGPSV
jgi:tetratricopeptide (TPR) repeat protein